MKKRKKFEIPIEGSVGLLALGDIGHSWLNEKPHVVEIESKKSKNEKTFLLIGCSMLQIKYHMALYKKGYMPALKSIMEGVFKMATLNPYSR